MLWKLIQNEWMKLFHRSGTYVMCGLLILGIIITTLFTFYDRTESKDLPSQQQWQEELQLANQNYAEQKNSNNYYIRTNAISNEAINNYRIEHNISPYEVTNVWTYLDTNTMLISLIGVFVIIVGSSIVAHEFNKGTIKLLLVRLASRTQILASKFITTILFALFLLVLLFGLSFSIGSLLFGLEGSSVHLSYIDGEVVERSRIIYLGLSYLSSSVTLLMLSSLAFMISTIFRSETLAIALSVMLLFIGTYVTDILALFTDWAKYSLFANTNLEVYFTYGPIVEGMTLEFSIIMLLIYLTFFLFLAFFFFKKRDVRI